MARCEFILQLLLLVFVNINWSAPFYARHLIAPRVFVLAYA